MGTEGLPASLTYCSGTPPGHRRTLGQSSRAVAAAGRKETARVHLHDGVVQVDEGLARILATSMAGVGTGGAKNEADGHRVKTEQWMGVGGRPKEFANQRITGA
jgi:hypothetical protein